MRQVLLSVGVAALLAGPAMGVVAVQSDGRIDVTLQADGLHVMQKDAPNLASWSDAVADSVIVADNAASGAASQDLVLDIDESAGTITGRFLGAATAAQIGTAQARASSWMTLVFTVTEPLAAYHFKGSIVTTDPVDPMSSVTIHDWVDNKLGPNLFASDGVSTGPFDVSGTLTPGEYVLFATYSAELSLLEGSEAGRLSFDFSLAPVPEPASLALLAMGGLGLLRRRMR